MGTTQVVGIAVFLISVLLQVVSLSWLPATEGFTRPVPVMILILASIAGMALLARLSSAGVPVTILVPISSAAVPMGVIVVGIVLQGEPASFGRVVTLTIACGLIGVASML
jgi:quaternary ammonium compound-resistance protein SugE